MNKKNVVTKLEAIASRLDAKKESLLVLAIDADLVACTLQLYAAEAKHQMGKDSIEVEITHLDEAIKKITQASAALGEAFLEAKLVSKSIKLFGE